MKKFYTNNQTGFNQILNKGGVYPIGVNGFNPNSISGLFYQGAQFVDNRFVSKATSQTGNDTRVLLDKRVNNLNGSTQNAIVNDNEVFDITDHLTVIVRAKNDSATLSSTQILVGKYDTTGNQREWTMGGSSTNLLVNQFGSATGTFAGQQTSTASLSGWNVPKTYAFTFDGGTVQQFVNGVNVASTTTTGTIPASLFNGTSSLTVGSRVGAEFWDGDIYEVIIFSGATGVLTESQIADIHDSIKANPTKNIQDTVYGLTGQTVVSHLVDVGEPQMQDISGNGRNGAYQNNPTVSATTSDSVNYLNQKGYSTYCYFDAQTERVNLNSAINATGDFTFQFYAMKNVASQRSIVLNSGNTSSYIDLASSIGVSVKNTAGSSVGLAHPILRDGINYKYKIQRSGSSISLYIDDVLEDTDTLTGTISISSVNLDNASFFFTGVLHDLKYWNDATQTNLVHHYGGKDNTNEGWLDSVGTNHGTVVGSPSLYYVAQDQSSLANGILGEALEKTGKALSYAYIEANNCIGLDGTNQEGVIGDIGNIDKIEGWFKLDIDNQMMCSLTNVGGTVIWVVSGVLTAGGSLTLGTIRVDNKIRNATQAGALLNDNDWHYVEINITSFDATNFRIGRGSNTYGDIHVAGLKLSLAGTNIVHIPMSEGAGIVSYDVSGGGNDISWTNTPTWATQDVYSYNIINGFEHYDDDATGTTILRVPYINGTPITPTISGYTKNSDNPSVFGHNNAESTFDFRNVSNTKNTIPETVFIDNDTDFTAFTFNADTGWDTYDYAFYRQESSVANDRFLIYKEDLTGTDLAKAKAYTNNT